MKSLILCFILLSINFCIYGQNFPCALGVVHSGQITLPQYKSAIPQDFVTIRTIIFIVRKSDGTGGITSQDMTLAISNVNNFFSAGRIKYIIAETRYIDNNTYYDMSLTTLSCTGNGAPLFDNYGETNAINIFFVNSINFPQGTAQGAARQIPGKSVAVTIGAATNGKTLAHELGHCLGLFHTFETCNGTENITRNQFDQCFNADVAGDGIIDTKADPNETALINGSCEFIPNNNVKDPCGTVYNDVPVNNLMSYYQNCRNSFTTDQFEVMQGTIGQIPEIKYLIDVQFSNKINGVNQSGTSLHVDGETVNSGDSKPLFYGIAHEGKTDNEILNSIYKHHDWSNISEQFRLVENFDINLSNPKRDANFLSIEALMIKVVFQFHQ